MQKTKVKKRKLENHPMCGVTTGGKEECYFDCKDVIFYKPVKHVINDVECLRDCFPASRIKKRKDQQKVGILDLAPSAEDYYCPTARDVLEDVISEEKTCKTYDGLFKPQCVAFMRMQPVKNQINKNIITYSAWELSKNHEMHHFSQKFL